MDTGDSSAAEAGAETLLETSARSLDYISAAKPPQPQSAAPAANQASNATLQTAASTTCHEQSQSTLSGVPHRGGGGGNRRSSNSSGSGTDGPVGAGDGRNTGTSRSRLHSIPDDIEVSENPTLQARSASVPLIDDDDDLDIDNNIMQAANNNASSTGAGTHATTLMSAGILPPVAGTLLAGRRNDSANSLGLGGGRAMRRTSDASDAESIAASSIAAASWMGSMGDSDMSGATVRETGPTGGGSALGAEGSSEGFPTAVATMDRPLRSLWRAPPVSSPDAAAEPCGGGIICPTRHPLV